MVSDRNEVGSVFKVFTLAAALEMGVTTLDEVVDCENGEWVYQRVALHDAGRRFGKMSVRDCLVKSSNIGFGKIALRMGPDWFYYYMGRFGFGLGTGIMLPHEIRGFIRPPSKWSGISITRLAMGQELSTTQIELAMAYAAIANEGMLMRPLIVSRVNHADGSLWTSYKPSRVRRVVNANAARQVIEAMRLAVDEGTGKAAALPRHTVAGKTGTAQKSDGHRYVPGRYYCSFCGIVPATDPRLVILVAVDEPKGHASGGAVAAPVFREIAEQAVELYDIPADKGGKAREEKFPRKGRSSRFRSVSLHR